MKTFFNLKSVVISLLIISVTGFSQSLDIPSSEWGLSIGNSKRFTGLRFNYRDHNVDRITGLNITLWDSYDNKESLVEGVSLGLMPNAGTLNGLNMGVLGAAAEHNANGISFGLLGAGAGGTVNGIAFGGLGVGAGESINGVMIGGLGAGAGQSITGLAIGGLGAGAGESLTGIGVGILGIGAGQDITGIVIGGLGAGAGNSITGLAIGGLGAGSPKIDGVVLAGLGAGGQEITGATLAIGMIKVDDDMGEGKHTGFTLSAFNYIKGKQTGVSLGIFNYAHNIKGFQFGIINYVRDNPTWLKILPILNFNFN